jgi:hypothetical protein
MRQQLLNLFKTAGVDVVWPNYREELLGSRSQEGIIKNNSIFLPENLQIGILVNNAVKVRGRRFKGVELALQYLVVYDLDEMK